MAEKDWKNRGDDWWTSERRSVMILKVEVGPKQIKKYRVRTAIGGFDNISQRNLQKRDFDSKPQAMTFATNYRRTHK